MNKTSLSEMLLEHSTSIWMHLKELPILHPKELPILQQRMESMGQASRKLAAINPTAQVVANAQLQGGEVDENGLQLVYTLNKRIDRVTQLWQEWEEGYDGGPAISLLELRKQQTGRHWHGFVESERKKNAKQW